MDNQVEILNYATKHFDICPAAVMAFNKLKLQIVDMAKKDRDYVLAALQVMDQMLGLEKTVVQRGVSSDEEKDQMLELNNTLLFHVGLISRNNESMLEDFEFTVMHIKQVMSPSMKINPAFEETSDKKIKTGHVDVSSSMKQCLQIVEDSTDIYNKLSPFSSEASLPTWWTNKLAISSAYLNSLRDYLMYDGETVEELSECEVEIKCL